MTTFSLPLNAKLTPEVSVGTNQYTYLQTGYVPTVFAVSLDVAAVSTATSLSNTNAFIVPAGYTLENARVATKTAFSGTSVGTVELKVGTGSTFTTLITTANIGTVGLVAANGTGAGSFGTPFAADTTVIYQVSVSGTAAQSGPITAGAGLLLITVGTPVSIAYQ